MQSTQSKPIQPTPHDSHTQVNTKAVLLQPTVVVESREGALVMGWGMVFISARVTTSKAMAHKKDKHNHLYVFIQACATPSATRAQHPARL